VRPLRLVALIIDFGMRERGVSVARMHRTDLDQILFEVLPRERFDQG
jgi:hypothetical protein